MELVWIEKMLTVIVSIFVAWGVMRERILKQEMKSERIEKDFLRLQESHEEHKDRMYEILKSISEQQQKILLILERNNVR